MIIAYDNGATGADHNLSIYTVDDSDVSMFEELLSLDNPSGFVVFTAPSAVWREYNKPESVETFLARLAEDIVSQPGAQTDAALDALSIDALEALRVAWADASPFTASLRRKMQRVLPVAPSESASET